MTVLRSQAGEWAQQQYKTKRWQRLRAQHLARYPYCQCPHCEGKRVIANTVDHKTPHRGDPRLFWNAGNLQSMTAECHSRWKQSEESGGKGFMGGCDSQGNPLNAQHDWYAAQ